MGRTYKERTEDKQPKAVFSVTNQPDRLVEFHAPSLVPMRNTARSVGVDQPPGTGSPINLSKANTIPTTTLTNKIFPIPVIITPRNNDHSYQYYSSTTSTHLNINTKTYPKRARILSNLKQINRITSSPKVKVKLPGFLLTNARSLAPKLDELEILLHESSADVAAVSETWLHKDIDSKYLEIQGFTFSDETG